VVTTTNRTTNETTQRTVGDIQLSFNTAAEYASKVGEINTEIAKRMTEVWLEGFRKQSELSQNTAQQFFKKVEEQGRVDESFFSRSFPFMWAPFVYDPFAFWREWAHRVQEDTRDAREQSVSTAREVRVSAAEQTARAVETTAPSNSSFPIAGYDEKNVEEISRRLNTLTGDQLQRVKDYERRNKNRETLVREIDRNIAAAS
jgi:Asp-tRNA(Asn)/Glu-tRNA(Gln) amidotransferase C subunit